MEVKARQAHAWSRRADDRALAISLIEGNQRAAVYCAAKTNTAVHRHTARRSCCWRSCRRWSNKRNSPGVTWWQVVRRDGNSSAGRHKAGRGDKAALVCDVRMQEDGTSCHPSTDPTCEDTLRDSRTRDVGEKGLKTAIGFGREASSGTTGDGNAFTSLKTLADERYGPADC